MILYALHPVNVKRFSIEKKKTQISRIPLLLRVDLLGRVVAVGFVLASALLASVGGALYDGDTAVLG